MRTKLRCPHCRQPQLARVARRGFFREKVWPFFGFYPWECAICRKEFLIRKRGAAYRKVNRSAEAGKYRDPAPSAERS